MCTSKAASQSLFISEEFFLLEDSNKAILTYVMIVIITKKYENQNIVANLTTI